MKKLGNLVSYAKKHNFLTATAICAALILVIILGYGLVNLPSILENISVEDTEATKLQTTEQTQPTNVIQVEPEQSTEAHTEPATEPTIECAVDFQSYEFGKAVAACVGVDLEDLTLEQLEELKVLAISGNSDIWNVADIALMPNLEEVRITDCALESVEGISALKNLKTLVLSGNQIERVRGLGHLDQLVQLDLSFNPVSQIENLAGLESLSVLNLDETNIADLDFLTATGVTELHISYANVKNVQGLAQCDKLETLYMYGYNFLDLTPLHELPNFHSIYLSRGFDHSQVDFLAGRFMTADKYTKVYLVLKNRGIDIYE